MFPENSFHSQETLCRSWNSRFAGKSAGFVEPSQGYRKITILGQKYYFHRVAWALYYGVWPENDIDHEDGNNQHNWIKNLRDVTEAVNMQNQVKRRNNTSGVNGVHWYRGKWHAAFRANGVKNFVGLFDCIDEAAKALSKAREDHGGFTSRHGQAPRLIYDL